MKTMNLKSTTMFSQVKYEEANPSFATAVMKIMAVEKMANKTSFPKQAIINALPTLKNIPLVSLYKVGENDLGGHETSYVIKNGKAKFTYGTDAIGVIPESANQWFETFEEDGKQIEYLMSDVLIWRRYDASELILKEGQFPVSMEIEIMDQFLQPDGTSLVKSFDFLAVAVLGSKKTPAFKSTYLKVFSEESDQLNELQQDLMMYLNQSTLDVKGGGIMENETIQTPKTSESVETTETVETHETPIVETFEEKTTETEDETKKSEDAEPKETTSDEKEETFEVKEEVVETSTDGEEEPTEKKEETFETEEVSPKVEEEEEKVEDIKTYQAEYEALLVAYAQLQQQLDEEIQKIQGLSSELETLRTFKAAIDQKEREEAEIQLFARFSQLAETEALTLLKETASTYELPVLEQQLFMLLGKQLYEAQQNETTAQVVVYEQQAKKDNMPCAFNILDKYL